jgi:integrase
MKKANFTAERISGFRCEAGKRQSIFWDGKVPGLGVRVTAAGAKSYIFETRLHGKTLRITIGDVRTWTISKAQAEATELKTLTDKGVDPRQQKAEQRTRAEAARLEEKRRDATLAEAWLKYLEARKHRWSEGHYNDHLSMASAGGQKKKRGKGLTEAGPLASLMPLPLTELTGSRVADWLKNESTKRPTSAALSFRLLRAFIGWTKDDVDYRGIVPVEVFSARIVRDALPKAETKEGDSLQREQLASWFSAILKIGNPVVRVYLQGLLLTGARRRELSGLKWTDVDFQWRSLTIRDKVEGTRIIPLTPYFASLIHTLPRRNEWVFSSQAAKDGRIVEPRYAHSDALKAAGLPHISLHGLRRSFGTLCEWVEVPSGISAQIMGHKPSALAEKHYRRRPLDLLRKWHDQIEDWILEQAEIKFDKEQIKPALKVVTAA